MEVKSGEEAPINGLERARRLLLNFSDDVVIQEAIGWALVDIAESLRRIADEMPSLDSEGRLRVTVEQR